MCNLGEALYEEAKQEGIKQGIEQALVDIITSKLSKGIDVPSIAKELEKDESYIKGLIEKYKLC